MRRKRSRETRTSALYLAVPTHKLPRPAGWLPGLPLRPPGRALGTSTTQGARAPGMGAEGGSSVATVSFRPHNNPKGTVSGSPFEGKDVKSRRSNIPTLPLSPLPTLTYFTASVKQGQWRHYHSCPTTNLHLHPLVPSRLKLV